MAEYTLIAPIEAYQLGEADPPSWYTSAVTQKSIQAQDYGKYLIGAADGYILAHAGDYVIYTAASNELGWLAKDTFEAAYELIEEEEP